MIPLLLTIQLVLAQPTDGTEPAPAVAEQQVQAPRAPEPTLVPQAEQPLRQLLPRVPSPGPRSALRLLLAALLCLGLATLAARAQRSLRPTGLLPGITTLGVALSRAAAAFLLIGAGAALAPAVFGVALPWAILAASLAGGWSLSVVAPDWLAGVLLAVERRVPRGAWLSGEDFAGAVERVGLRVTELRSDRGGRVFVPNRQVLASALEVRDRPWSRIDVRVWPPTDCPPARIREQAVRAARALPWTAPGPPPSVQRDDRGVWIVSARLLDPAHGAVFAEALRDELQQLQPAPDPPPPAPSDESST